MNKSKIFLMSVLLSTSTVWGQPDEYLHDVEESPTSLTALFDDSSETKPIETFVAAADPALETEAPVVAQAPVTRAKRATRGIASVPPYNCTAATEKIKKGDKLSKAEMSTYKKYCK